MSDATIVLKKRAGRLINYINYKLHSRRSNKMGKDENFAEMYIRMYYSEYKLAYTPRTPSACISTLRVEK